MDEAPESVSPADDETQPGGVSRLLWRGLRVLALLSVMALLGLLIWGLQKGQAGSKYVDQTRAGKHPQAPAFDLPGFRQQLEERTPLHRVSTPDEIARPIRFLLSDEASFITGTHLTIDGGLTAITAI